MRTGLFARFMMLFLCVAAILWAIDAGAQPHQVCIDSTKFLTVTPNEPGGGPARPPGGPAAGPPPGPHNIGDSWPWYTWSFGGGPPSWTSKTCTIRGISANAYLVVENSVWGTQVTQADVDTVLDHFENVNYTTTLTGGIYDLDVEAFGNPPLGLDNDPRIYLLYYDFNITSDGFFWIFDTDPDGTSMYASNECEVLYLNCGPDAGVDHDPGNPYMIGVIAHELGHLIHHEYDSDEENWLAESLCEYAMFRYGADDPGNIAAFLAAPDVDLVAGGSYGAWWFFGAYLGVHYGGPAFTRTLVNEPANGITGVNNALGVMGYMDDFADVMSYWVVANFVNDPSIGSGEYGYGDYTFAPIARSATHGSFPLGATSATVKKYGTDYVRFEGYTGLNIAFDGRNTDTFSLHFVEVDDVGTLTAKVTTVVPDAQRMGSVDVLAGGHNATIMVVGGLEPGAPTLQYSYTAQIASSPVLLTAVKLAADPLTGVDLSWTGGSAPFNLYRSLDETTIRDPGSLYAGAVTTPWPLSGQTEDTIYYSIEP